ncbi:MAG: flavodoxin family protein [Promethearchaeota archaeon]
MVQKKILLLNSSPRKNGMTNSLLEIFKNKIENLNKSSEQKVLATIIQLSDFTIQHCNGCDSCLRKPYECPLSNKDDMKKLEEILIDSDAIIVGSPSYFANVPGIMKDVIDRSRPMKMAKYKLKNKLFSIITVSGLREGGNNFVVDTLIHWALIQGMIVIASLGHPVLMNNLPSESLQKGGLKEFRDKNEPSDLAKILVENLAERFFKILPILNFA